MLMNNHGRVMETSFDSERLSYASDSERMTVSDHYSNSSCNDLPLINESASEPPQSDFDFAASSADERDRGWNLLDVCSDIDSEHYDHPAENLMGDENPTIMPDCADEQPISVPLYEGSTITVSEAMLLILQFSLRFAIKKLYIGMINCACGMHN